MSSSEQVKVDAATDEILIEALPEDQSAQGPVETITMTWEQRSRPRRKCTTSKGTTVSLALPRGTVLSNDALIYNSPTKTIQVKAQAEEVLIVSPANPMELCVIAHHLGNWHRSLQLNDDGTIVIEHDSPLAHWLDHEHIAYAKTQASYHPNLKGHSHD
jgi:urease accessory protein